jgi:hypothetical protein
LQALLRFALPLASVVKDVRGMCLGFSPVPLRSRGEIIAVLLLLLLLLLLVCEVAERPAKPLAGSTKQFSVRDSRYTLRA